MRVNPGYLILALAAALGLYLAGVSVGTLIFVLAFAYMASMHLGGGHGGGHGGAGSRTNAAQGGGEQAASAADVQHGSHH